VRAQLRSLAAQGLEHALYQPMRLLPTAFASAMGRMLARRIAPALYPALDARARANLALLRPDLPTDAAVAEMWENLACTFCEIPRILRFWKEGRVEVDGAEHILETRRHRPVLAAWLHTGNPEVLGMTLAWIGARPVGIAARQPTGLRDRVVMRNRLAVGIRVLRADRDAVRPALRVLAGREEVLALAMDDYVGGIVHGPSLGRGPRTKGNIPYAVRLARLTGCAIVPGYVTRLPGSRFRTTFLPPVELPPETGDRAADLAAGAAALDAVLDLIVRANLPQWYFTIAWRPES